MATDGETPSIRIDASLGEESIDGVLQVPIRVVMTLSSGKKINFDDDNIINTILQLVNSVNFKAPFVALRDSEGVLHNINISRIEDVEFIKITT